MSKRAHRAFRSFAIAGAAALFAGEGAGARAEQPREGAKPIGTVTVSAAGKGRPRPRLVVAAFGQETAEARRVLDIVRGDLDLAGDFEVIADDDLAVAARGPAVDPTPFAAKGVHALVRLAARATKPGEAEVRVEAYAIREPPKGAKKAAFFHGVDHADRPVYEARRSARAADLRILSHRAADRLLGELTGFPGSFAGRIAFTSTAKGTRQVLVMDADGERLSAVSPPGEHATDPAFGPSGELFYAASADGREFGVRSRERGAIALPVTGSSVYGLAVAPDGSRVALAIGEGSSRVRLFLGTDFATARPAFDVDLAMDPTFSPSGEVAFAGEARGVQRVYLGGKPITPPGVFASSPSFCNHPDGPKLVFAMGADKTEVVVTGERGGPLARISRGHGEDGSPACSPDGRLVAFFSTRTVGEGPGLYVMRLDGTATRRLAAVEGYAPVWARRPPSEPPVF